MNRLVALLALLTLAPAALAQDAAAPAAPADAAQDAAPAVDPAAVKGQADALAEQLAEVKTSVDALRKLKISGYVQGRWAWQEAVRYDVGANASTPSNPKENGFFIRRGRIKAAYDADWSQYVLQLDATPAGVGVKEAYAAVKLPQGFAVDAGLQLFPFGYEVGVRSSADLDLLERSMVVKYFEDGEYDLGVALRGARGPLSFKVGVFNGNGVNGNKLGQDNDQRKDLIGRVGVDLGVVTGGVSGWYGKTIQYKGADTTYDRLRAGADLQVYLDLVPLGGTALKGEYIWGRTGIGPGKETGVGIDLGKTSSGWYGLLTQNVGRWSQVAVRYEQFRRDQGDETLKPQKAVQAALHTFVGESYKVSVAWFHPLKNEADQDPNADQLIVQAQAKF